MRADSRLLGTDQERIVRVIDYLLESAFPGVSGFSHDRRPPHRVEGGACGPLTKDQRARVGPRQRRRARRDQRPDPGPLPGAGPPAGRGARDLETLQPGEMEGLLREVEAARRDRWR